MALLHDDFDECPIPDLLLGRRNDVRPVPMRAAREGFEVSSLPIHAGSRAGPGGQVPVYIYICIYCATLGPCPPTVSSLRGSGERPRPESSVDTSNETPTPGSTDNGRQWPVGNASSLPMDSHGLLGQVVGSLRLGRTTSGSGRIGRSELPDSTDQPNLGQKGRVNGPIEWRADRATRFIRNLYNSCYTPFSR